MPVNTARQRRVAFAAVSGAFFATTASAAEFCVTCDTPAAHYKCVLPGPAGNPGDARLKIWCMTELAKAGNHASCTVDRQAQSGCDGEVKQLALPGGYEVDLAPPAAAEHIPAEQQPPPAAAAGQPVPPAQTDVPKTQNPPATVKEAVEKGVESTEKAIGDTEHAAAEAAKATGSTVEKAGQAVGNAAKKTWKCITSLFGDC